MLVGTDIDVYMLFLTLNLISSQYIMNFEYLPCNKQFRMVGDYM